MSKNKYIELKETVAEYIQKIKKGDATLSDLENEVINVTTVPLSVVYHPQQGNKSIETSNVKEWIEKGWFKTPADFPPERPDFLTPEQWDICDGRLVHSWGLSLSSFTEDVMGLDKSIEKNKDEHRETYNAVIKYYGSTIKQTERMNCTIYKRKDFV